MSCKPRILLSPVSCLATYPYRYLSSILKVNSGYPEVTHTPLARTIIKTIVLVNAHAIFGEVLGKSSLWC